MLTREFKLKDFDGPLDLLLTLIGKAQIDIRDIFVSEITDQYLEIVRNAPDLNMDESSDFLVVAATLLPPGSQKPGDAPETGRTARRGSGNGIDPPAGRIQAVQGNGREHEEF